MNNDNGKLYFGVGLDNSQLQADAAQAGKILQGIDEEATKQSAAVRELLTNIPTINLDIITNAGSALETIDIAFEEIDHVFDENKYAIKELEKEYERLAIETQKAFKKGDNKTVNELRQQAKAVKEVIKVREQVNKEVAQTADQLAKEEQKLKAEAAEAEKSAQKHVSLRQRLREVKEQLIEMEIAGQRGTDAYKALQQEAGRLADAWADAQAQATILAHDQRGMQGIISGLQGVAGAASVAQGAIGLFGGENERLQQIMLKVQSLMAITMGLQQIQQTLNKDSAFSLVTLNSLKQMWNKITGKNIATLEVENATIATNTEEQVANTVAKEVDTIATEADTVAQNTNNSSTIAGTAAQVANTGATKTATTATVAQTVATRAASIALRGLKAALISTGIGALIVLIGELIGWLSDLFTATSKADEEFEEQQKILSKGREAYSKASMEIETYKIRLDKFNGTKEQEKKLVQELNQHLGEQMGFYQSIDEWKKALIEKGDAYCEHLMRQAEAQELLNDVTAAYVKLKEVEDKAKKGEFDGSFWNPLNWFESVRRANRNKAIKEAQDDYDEKKKRYTSKVKEDWEEMQKNGLGGHTDPTTAKSHSGGGKTFDPQKAALETKKAVEEYTKACSKYIKDANDEMTNLIISNQEQGLAREISEINKGTRQKLDAWNDQLEKLAEVRKNAAKTKYMNTKGATEVGWENSVDGKKTIKDWIEVMKKESPELITEFDRVWNKIIENGNKAVKNAQQKYTDALIDEFGSIEQKREKLERLWANRLNSIPLEFKEQAWQQMENEISKLQSNQFKLSINWESVFGDMTKQSLPVLEFTLNKIKQYFEKNKDSMSVQEIKDYQEAITKMEDEIANRNPFTALHKSIKDIGTSKQELVDALNNMKASQEELNTAIKERNDILKEYNDILEKVKNGELESGGKEQTQAYEKLTKAKERVAKATENNVKAEQRAMTAQNRSTASYKAFAQNLSKVGGVIKGLGGQAKDLAYIFSDDVANSIGTAIDCIDSVLDATSNVISSIGDLGKGVASGVESAVQASAAGATSAAATGAAAISTIEKASIILAVISSALQVATAIARLFNSDDSKQKEIDALQRRIDQLQWELNNSEAVRLQDTYGDAVERLRNIYASTTQEIKKMHSVSGQSTNFISYMFSLLRQKGEIYQGTVEKIADAYANMSYTADKALGTKKYDEAKDKLKNLAEQQVLIQQQIDAENGKKKSDKGKIQEYENKIKELGAEMASITNKILEDVIGATAENLASELGDAFFEAAKQGEDAMEAWHKKVNDLIGDIIKRMLVTKYLEPEIGRVYNKYKDQWFENGKFKGEKAMASMDEFASELNNIGANFQQAYSGLSESIKKYSSALDDAGREASQKGIATASQESVDELNGRATAIQGHTYNICEYSKQLVTTTNLILQSVVNIESETKGFSARLERMEGNLKGVKDTIDDIALKGIKIQ